MFTMIIIKFMFIFRFYDVTRSKKDLVHHGNHSRF